MKHHLPQDLYKHITISRSHLLILGAVFLGALIIGGFSHRFWPRAYTATTTLVIKPRETANLSDKNPSTPRFDSRRFLKAQANVITSRGFLNRTAGELGLPKRWNTTNRRASSILRSSTKVSRSFRNRQIDIEYSSADPEEAVEIANAIGEAYVKHWQNLHNDRYDQMLASIKSDHAQFKSAVAVKLAAVEILEADEVSTDELAKTKAELAEMKVKNATFESQIEKVNHEKLVINSASRISGQATIETVTYGANIGAGVAFIFMMAIFSTSATAGYLYWRTKNKTSITDIARAVAPPTLTIFPRSEKSFSEMTGPFQKLREGIIALFPSPEGITIASIPCLVKEDASPIACELAKVLGEGGNPTILIEGNLNEPMIHHVFNASPHPGVAEYLSGEMGIKETVVKSRHDNLWIMPGGAVDEISSGLLSSPKMEDLIRDAKSRFDFVVFNGSPILSSVDSLILTGESNMTFLVTEAGKASNDVLTRTRYAIEQAGGKLAGLVLTNVEPDEADKAFGIEAAVVKA